MDAVHWDGVVPIAASWVISPLLSGIVAFMIFISVHKLILDTDDPFANAKRYVPFYMFAVGFVVTILTLTKGLKHIGLDISFAASLGWALIGGLIVAVIGASILSRIQPDPEADKDFRFSSAGSLSWDDLLAWCAPSALSEDP